SLTMATFDIEAFVSDPSLIVFDKCKKSDLRVVAEYYGVPVSNTLVKAELKVVLLDELVSRGFFSLPVSGDAQAGAAASPGEGRPAGEAEQPVTPVVTEVKTSGRPVTIPHFVPFSVESTPGSKVDARLKVRLARLQLEKEERESEREFQFRRELELKRLEPSQLKSSGATGEHNSG
ncbi:hypothetical protein GBF38_007778, partial [Nibea albiflora]